MATQTITANGDYDFKSYRKTHIHVVGSFGGGTVQVKLLADDGTTYLTLPNDSYTAAFSKIFEFTNHSDVRLTVSGATTPSMTVNVRGE